MTVETNKYIEQLPQKNEHISLNDTIQAKQGRSWK